jgi:hypothetical protein
MFDDLLTNAAVSGVVSYDNLEGLWANTLTVEPLKEVSEGIFAIEGGNNHCRHGRHSMTLHHSYDMNIREVHFP